MAKIITRFVSMCIIPLFLTISLYGCADKGKVVTDSETVGQNEEDTLTVMHVDYEIPGVIEYFKQAGEALGININLVGPPANPDTRQAHISTLLASGDSSVDIFTINDEMISEFKNEGYIDSLNDIITPAEQINYPQEYFIKMIMDGDKVYSIPYRMDILVLWVNERWLNEAGLTEIDSKEELKQFLTYSWGNDRFAYGGAWEKTYAYNEIGEFINLFEGNYYDFHNPRTQEAIQFMKELVKSGSAGRDILLDQYDQMNQKFISDRYGMEFMFCGGMNSYIEAGVYGDDHIHVIDIPSNWKKSSYVATWQYALNHASKNKDTARKLLKYMSRRDECIKYAEMTNTFPARTDIIVDEDLNVIGYDEVKRYLRGVTLLPRPIPENALIYIEQFGELFQQYILDELTLEEYTDKVQELIDDNF